MFKTRANIITNYHTWVLRDEFCLFLCVWIFFSNTNSLCKDICYCWACFFSSFIPGTLLMYYREWKCAWRNSSMFIHLQLIQVRNTFERMQLPLCLSARFQRMLDVWCGYTSLSVGTADLCSWATSVHLSLTLHSRCCCQTSLR